MVSPAHVRVASGCAGTRTRSCATGAKHCTQETQTIVLRNKPITRILLTPATIYHIMTILSMKLLTKSKR